GSVLIENLQTGKQTRLTLGRGNSGRTFPPWNPLGVQVLAFAPDGYMLAVSSPEDGILSFYDVDTGRQIGSEVTSGITQARFSPNRKILATVGLEGVQLWDVARHVQIGELSAGSDLADLDSLEFNPDGSMLVVANGWSLKLWDVATRHLLAQIDDYNDNG